MEIEKQKLEAPQSIHQSSVLHLVQNENLKRLINKNPELENEIEETEKLLNSKLKIKTINEFDEIVGKITGLGFNTIQEAEEKAERLNEVKSKEELEIYLKAKKFCYYKAALDNFLTSNVYQFNDAYGNLFGDFDSDCKYILNTINAYEDSVPNGNRRYDETWPVKICTDVSSSIARAFLTSRSCISLILLRDKHILGYICNMIYIFSNALTSKIILILLSTPDRYNFFLRLHKMLEYGLTGDNQQFFHNYLKVTREKLQHEKDNYKIFNKKVRNLTGIFIFGIIASAAVLTINLLKVYAATWFFWFGIVGVILTVAVGIRLFLCIKENWNDLKKLKSDLQKENKTIGQKINEIGHAMEVYDLNKIKSFKEPEPGKISTFDVNKNKIILNDNEINTNKIDTIEQGNDPKSEPIHTEQNRTDS